MTERKLTPNEKRAWHYLRGREERDAIKIIALTWSINSHCGKGFKLDYLINSQVEDIVKSLVCRHGKTIGQNEGIIRRYNGDVIKYPTYWDVSTKATPQEQT